MGKENEVKSKTAQEMFAIAIKIFDELKKNNCVPRQSYVVLRHCLELTELIIKEEGDSLPL